MNHIQLLDPPCVASPQSRRLAQTSSSLSNHTCPTVGAVSATSTTTMLKPHSETIVPDCAICLDNIRPKHHAKAILACRHEFHLSCISMAFTMGKEMICPLCRFLHKDQPFMGPEEVSGKLPVPSPPGAAAAAAAAAVAASAAAIASSQTTPANSATVSSGRNRHRNNSIHLQHNLSNLMQHQQRRRSTYDLRRASVTSLSSPSSSPSAPVTPPAQDNPDSEGSILSRVPFFGATSHAQQQEQAPPVPSLPAPSSSASLPPNAYLNTSTWFMLYGMPFSVAMLFLAFILGQVETLWSKVSCLIGSVICYMVCWALAVGLVLPVQECPSSRVSYQSNLVSSTATARAAAVAAAAAAAVASSGEARPNSGTGSIASAVLDAVSSSLPHLPVSASVSPTIPSSMAFEFELASDLGLDTTTPSSASPSRSTSASTYPFQYIFQIRERPQQQLQQRQQQQHQQLQEQQQPPQQRQSGLEVERREEEVLVSSLSMFPWLIPGASSLSRWMMASQYARDVRRRISDLADILDDYSESFGGW